MKPEYLERIYALQLFLGLILLISAADAAQDKPARITQTIKEVNLLPPQESARRAVVNDYVNENTAVRTGTDSRTELTFADRSVARLGANTVLALKDGTGNLELNGGAMLLAVPKDAGGVKLSTAALTTAVTGTGVFEHHSRGLIKILCLEGELRAYLNNKVGESVLLSPGDILITQASAKHLDAPNKFSIRRFMQTALLVIGFKKPLPPGFLTLIAQAVVDQQNDKSLVETNLVIFGGGGRVSITEPTNTKKADQKEPISSVTPAPSASPTATPGREQPTADQTP